MDVIFRSGWDRRAHEYDAEAWVALSRWVVDSLEQAVGWILEVDGAVSVGDGFSVDLRSAVGNAGILDLRLRAVLGADVHDDRLLVRAWLFLYTGAVQLRGPGECLELELTSAHESPWSLIGWSDGEPGEHDAFLRF